MTLVIEIVKQGCGGVEGQQLLAGCSCQAKPVSFGLSIGHDAGLDSQGVLTQALALRPLREQSPCGRTIVSG